MTFSEHHSVCVMYWGEMMEKAIRPKPFFSLYPDRSRGHFTIISMVFRWMVVVIFFLLFLLLLLFILSTFPIERFWQLPNQMLILILLRLVCCRYYFFLYRFVLFAMKKRGKERERERESLLSFLMNFTYYICCSFYFIWWNYGPGIIENVLQGKVGANFTIWFVRANTPNHTKLLADLSIGNGIYDHIGVTPNTITWNLTYIIIKMSRLNSTVFIRSNLVFVWPFFLLIILSHFVY